MLTHFIPSCSWWKSRHFATRYFYTHHWEERTTACRLLDGQLFVLSLINILSALRLLQAIARRPVPFWQEAYSNLVQQSNAKIYDAEIWNTFEILETAAENNEFNNSTALDVGANDLQILLEEVRHGWIAVVMNGAKKDGRSHGFRFWTIHRGQNGRCETGKMTRLRRITNGTRIDMGTNDKRGRQTLQT